jgi:hypothetical protein
MDSQSHPSLVHCSKQSARGAWFSAKRSGYHVRSPGPLKQCTLGGPLRLSAYGADEFRGNAYVLCWGSQPSAARGVKEGVVNSSSRSAVSFKQFIPALVHGPEPFT